MLGDSLGEFVPMGTGRRNIDPGAKVSGGGMNLEEEHFLKWATITVACGIFSSLDVFTPKNLS